MEGVLTTLGGELIIGGSMTSDDFTGLTVSPASGV
jgi:hypothetical protein